jgi:putative transcriptional regulator
MTPQTLVDRVGITRQTIIALEQGKYYPSLELAFLIAETFGVGLEEVFQIPERFTSRETLGASLMSRWRYSRWQTGRISIGRPAWGLGGDVVMRTPRSPVHCRNWPGAISKNWISKHCALAAMVT